MNAAKIEKSAPLESDIKKINAFSRRELTEDDVYIFSVTLCDNDIDRDYESFSTKALGELAPLFVGKTGIFDHSMKSSDQKARIFDAFVEKADGEKTAFGEQLYRLKARAYMLKNDENRLLIDEIEGGIKKEVSVSCSMENSICSVCGKDKRKERCEHIKGRYYAGKLCYCTLSGASDAYEFSFVAVPAQRGAGVTKSYDFEKDTDMNEIIEKMHDCKEGISLSTEQTKQLSSYICSLEEDAQLGEEYKKELSKEVTKLLCQRIPEVDSKLIASVASVMTVKELVGIRQGLVKSTEPAAPQLAAADEKQHTKDYSQFRI